MAAALRAVDLEPTLLEVADAPHFAMNGDKPLPWEQLEAERSGDAGVKDSDATVTDTRKHFVCEPALFDFLRKHLRIDELAGETPQQRAARTSSSPPYSGD